MKLVSELNEDEIIRLFDSPQIRPEVIKGIGDDCSILDKDSSSYYVITTDLLSEDVHFRRHGSSSEKLGYKSLAVNLSDIAAMGADPVSCFLSISLPTDLEIEWLNGFKDGLRRCADQFAVQIAGGDTAANKKQVFISITVVGIVKKEKILRRDTAQPGEDIWISKQPGLSASGFYHLEKETNILDEEFRKKCVVAHLEPVPEIHLGQWLSDNNLASSCMDCSDGISRDLQRLCIASGVGARLALSELKSFISEIDDNCNSLSGRSMVLHGGEDYSLIFTSKKQDAERLRKKDNLIHIGETVSKKGVYLEEEGSNSEIVPAGYEHFG